jgi:hypothetical protein
VGALASAPNCPGRNLYAGSVAPPSVSALRRSTSSAMANASRTRWSLKGARFVLNW